MMKKIAYLFITFCILNLLGIFINTIGYAQEQDLIDKTGTSRLVVGVNAKEKDHYMDVVVSMQGLLPNTTYPVFLGLLDSTDLSTMADRSGIYVRKYTPVLDETQYEESSFQNPQYLKTDTFGTVTEHFYLKNGQYITITEIPEVGQFVILENESNYDAQYQINGDIVSDENVKQWRNLDKVDHEVLLAFESNEPIFRMDIFLMIVIVTFVTAGISILILLLGT